MKKIVAGFCRSCEAVSLFISRIAMWLSATIVAVMMFEVISRYVFEAPTLWANESSLWMAGFLYLFAGLYAMRERGHIRVTVVYNSLSRKGQLVLDAVGTLVVVLFAVALVVGGWDIAWKALTRWETLSTAWEPPIPATIKPAILICAVLVAVQAVSNFFADFHKDAPAPPEGETADTSEVADFHKKDAPAQGENKTA